MGLTLPYGQNHYMGEYATEGAALTWIRGNKWDSVGDGSGNPKAGMAFFDTAAAKIKVHDGSAWAALGSASAAGSTGYVQFNNGGAFAADTAFFWDNSNKRLGIGTVIPKWLGIETVGVSTSLNATAYATGEFEYPTLRVTRGRGTEASPAAVQSGDGLGALAFRGFFGTGTSDHSAQAVIYAYASEAWNATNRGAYLTFKTTADASATSTERMRITNAGNLIVGTTTEGVVVNGTTYTSPLKVSATVSGNALGPIFLESAGGPALVRHFVAGGTLASRTIVGDGSALGGIGAYGYDGTDYINTASVQFFVDGTSGTDDMPGRIVFFTTSDGAASWTERMRITSAGKVGIANTSPGALLTLGTAGTTAGTVSLAGGTSGVVTVQTAAAAGTWSLTLPTTGGTNGYYLQTNGSGVTTWAAVSATPAGSSYQIQYNNAGAFGASANMAWDGTSRFTMTADQTWAGCSSQVYASGGTNSPYYGFYRWGNTQASPAAVGSGNILGELLFHGAYSSSQVAVGWRVMTVASGTWSSGVTPSYISFVSRVDGTTDGQVMRLDYQGKVGIGAHTSLTERLDLYDGSGNGAIRIGNTATSNAGTIKYTSSTFSGYNGSSWVNFGGGAPAGSTGYVQFNNAGAFAADAALFWDNTNKRLGIGCTDPVNSVEISKDTANASIFISAFSNSTNYGTFYVQRGRGTRASKLAVQSGDRLGQFGFAGYYDTTNNYGCSFIASCATENWASGARGSDIRFELTAATTTTPVECMRITSAGNVYVGLTTAPSVSGAATTRKFIVSGDSASTGIGNEAAGDAPRFECYRANNTLAVKQIVVSGDLLGNFAAYGWDAGTTPSYIVAGQFRVECDGTVAEDNVPGRLTFYTRNTSGTMAERVRLTSEGNVLIGTTSGVSQAGVTYTNRLLVSGTNNSLNNVDVAIETAATRAALHLYRCNNTVASKTAVASGDNLGSVNFHGWDGGTTPTYVTAAQIKTEVDGTVSEDVVPGRIVFGTANTGGTFGERMRLTSAGKLGIANTAPSALLTLGTAGTTAGSLSLAGATSGTCTVQVAAVAGTVTFQLPVTNGTNGYFLKTDGAGVTSWAAVSSGTTVDAGTAQGQVLFWNATGSAWTYAETSEWVWDDTNKRVGINVAAPSSRLDVGGDVEIASDAWHYYGDPTTDGSWRTGRVSADLVVQKRESGTWTTKHTFV